MPDVEIYPQDDGVSKLALNVTNRGDTPTTITHMIVYKYRSWFHRWRTKPHFTAIVPNPVMPGMVGTLPYELGLNKYWLGVLNFGELSEAREKGELYVGVIASHSNRNFLVHVPPRKDIPTQEIVNGAKKKDS
jgi:hypothetical protein